MVTLTRRDPSNQLTVAALAHLAAAQDARNRYDVTLTNAIADYGDRHTPTEPGHYCFVCITRDIRHTDHERLNHQTGAMIAGIYADHFPDAIKTRLRTYARLIGEHSDLALLCWERSGRRRGTFLDMLPEYRKLADGRVSYY